MLCNVGNTFCAFIKTWEMTTKMIKGSDLAFYILEEIRPEIILVPCSKLNSYGTYLC